MAAEQKNLPAGWAKMRLKEVTHLRNEKIEPRGTDAKPYLSLEHIESGTNRIVNYGSSKEVKSTKSIFYSGDVLYGKLRPYLNKVCQPEVDGVCSTDILVFAPSPAIDSGFLLRFLSREETVEYANMHSKGINLPRLSANQLGEMEIDLPPLSEQKRIVVRIEELQARSRRAREALESVPDLLEQLRQSILAAAFRGDLTKKWRDQHPDAEPASELLKRIRTERRQRWEASELKRLKAKGLTGNQLDAEFTKRRKQYQEPAPVNATDLPELPGGWCWTRICDVGNIQLGRQRAPRYHTGKYMRPYLRVQNVFEDRLDLSDIMEMDFPPDDYERYHLKPGDILLNEGQSLELVGRPAMYHGEIPGACFTNTLLRFTPAPQIESEYPLLLFIYYLHSGRFRQDATISTNIAHLGAARFAQIEFALPPKEEQELLVKLVRGAIDWIQRFFGEQLAVAERLKGLDQSILSKAFRGELVPQVSNDEPASVLLERIGQEKATLAANQKSTGKRKGK